MSDNMDDDEVIYLSPNSVVNNFGGEDLCERAGICRRNGFSQIAVPLNHFNEGFIESMVNKEPKESNQNQSDFEIDSIVKSVLDTKTYETIYSSNSSENNSSEHEDDIEQLFNDSEVAINWTPNVLAKPKEEEFIESGYSSIRDFDDSMFSCMSFTSVSAEPYDSVQAAFSFQKSFKERLKRLECRDVRLELCLWPYILKNISITCVSSPKSGKTNSYLVPLMNWFDSKEVEKDKDYIGIGAIVLCPSARQTYEIARLAKQWRDPRVPQMEQTIRILSMNSTNDKKLTTAILNGCDILITTPEPLLRMIENSIIDCSKTRALIIDDADVTISLHMKAVREIYLYYANTKKNNKRFVQRNGNVSNPLAFQTMIFSHKWTQGVQWFSRELQHMPSQVFGSYYELSIAMKVECKVVVIDSEEHRENRINRLVRDEFNNQQQYPTKRIAIVCETEREITFLKRHIKVDNKYIIEVSDESPHFDLNPMKKKWNQSGGLLFITENAIKIVSGFRTYAIIHYRLPKNFDDFGDRFRLMNKIFRKSKNIFEPKSLRKLINYVVVSPIDPHISQIITYLNRLNAPIPQKLIAISNYQRRQLCIHFCSFGKCPLESEICADRHCFNENDIPNIELPQNGQIKIVVTYVMGANQFYFRLQEFRNESQASGIWSKMNVTYDDIRPELNALKDKPFNTVKEVSFETVYGIAIRGEVLRVRVLRILPEEELKFYEEYDPNDKSQKIEVFCIDLGNKLRSWSRQLFKLPESLKSLSSFAFKAYLFGIKPIDNEIEWDFRATHKFYNLVENYRISQITAWILKQIDGVFWLNELNVEKKLKNARLKLASNPMKFLIENKFVDKNDETLQGMNTDYYKILHIWHNYRLNTVAYNSCLVDDSSYVVVTDFVSINEIYVMYENRVKKLQELEDKWLSYLPSLEPLMEVIDEQICFYKGFDNINEENYVNRAKVVINDENISIIDVFLVDHGETVKNVRKEDLFKIGEEQLKVFPFQAIKVSLFGVKQIKEITFDVICDLTRDESNRYLMAIAEKQSYDNNIHTIRLLVSQNLSDTYFVALSKLLVDLNYAQFVDNEEDNELEVIIERIVDDPNEEPESDQMEYLEEYMKDMFVKDYLRNYITQQGIDEPLFLEEEDKQQSLPQQERGESSAQPRTSKESRASKTVRRLKAITAKNKAQTQENESSDESDDENKKFTKKIIENTGEFDYEIDPDAPLLFYDPTDHIDDDCQYSDEEGILEEEDFS